MATSHNAVGVLFERSFLWMLFFAAFALNIYFVSPAIAGMPIRFLFTLALLAILSVAFNRSFVRTLVQGRWIYAIVAYLGLIGFMLGILRDKPGAIAAALMADHVQGLAIFTVTAIGTNVLGRQSMTRAFIAAVGVSILFSVMQAIGISFATQVRDYLGSYYFQTAADVEIMAGRFPGLSYSPIILANHVCLLFAIVTALAFQYSKEKNSSNFRISECIPIAIAGFVLIGASVIEGNRSPLLGFVCFCALTLSARRRKLLIVLLPLLVFGLLLIGPVRDYLAGSDLRIAATGDKSEAARTPLMIYGWRLFEANPLGYGLTFDSKVLANTVNMGDMAATLSAGGLQGIVTDRDLHNYWLSFLNVYGLFLLPVAMAVVVYGWRNWAVTVAFMPYLVHITFHNVAPLLGDYMFWVPVGIIVAGFRRVPQRQQPSASSVVASQVTVQR